MGRNTTEIKQYTIHNSLIILYNSGNITVFSKTRHHLTTNQ